MNQPLICKKKAGFFDKIVALASNNKILISFIIAGLLTIITIMGATAHNYDPVHYYQFESATEGLDEGVTGESNSVEPGNEPEGYVAAIVGDGVDFERANSDYLQNASFSNQSNIQTVELWIKPESTSNFQAFLSLGDVSTNNNLEIREWDNGKYSVRLRQGGTVQFQLFSTTNVVAGEWVYIVAKMGSGGAELFVNGTSEDTDASTADFGGGTYAPIVVGGRQKANNQDSFGDGIVDNLAFWEEQYDSTDAIYGYNEGNGRNYSAQTADTVTLVSPATGTITNNITNTYKYHLLFASTNPDTAQLYTNESGTWTAQLTNTTPKNATENNFVHNLSEGTYLWNIRINSTNGSVFWADNNSTIEIDITEPVFSTDDSNVWSNNYAVITGDAAGPNLIGQINVTDPNGNLWSFNASIIGQRVIHNITQIGNSSLTFNLNHDVSDLAPGKYNLSIYAADGHTAKKIRPYTYRRNPLGNSIKYDFDNSRLTNKKHITINVEGTSGSLTTQKQKDRYSWTYSPGSFSPKNQVVKHLTSSHEIVPVTNSDYKAHFVIPQLEKWVDFELQNPTGKENYNIQKISNKHYIITITNLNLNQPVTFQSIGDLNTNQQNYTFEVINTTSQYTSIATDGSTNTFTLNFTTTNKKINANLTYNNTLITDITNTNTSNSQAYTATITSPTLNQNTNASIPFQWNFTIQAANTIQNNTNITNQTIQPILIRRCSAHGGTPIQNYTFYNETNHANLNANVEVVLDYQYNNQQKSYTDSATNVNSYAFCTNVNQNLTQTDVLLDYSIPGGLYQDKEYTRENYVIGPPVEKVSLYTLLTTAASSITIKVKDQDDNDVENAIVQAHRFNTSTNTYFVAETDITDPEGQTLFTLVSDTVFYKFKVLQNGNEKLETNKFKLTQAEYTLRIGDILGSTPLSQLIRLKEISTDLSYSNTTKNFSLTYANARVDQVCLNVSNSTDQLSNQCSTNTADNISYNLGSDPQGEYIAKAQAYDLGTKTTIDSLSVQLGGLARTLGLNLGTSTAFLLTLTMFLIGLASPKLGIASGIASSWFIYALGIVNFGILVPIGITSMGIIMLYVMKERFGA